MNVERVAPLVSLPPFARRFLATEAAGGMVAPAAIYLALNAGRPGTDG